MHHSCKNPHLQQAEAKADASPGEMHSRRKASHFYISSLLTMQNAYSFAYSVGAPFGDAQCHSGGIYAFAYRCWSQSKNGKQNTSLLLNLSWHLMTWNQMWDLPNPLSFPRVKSGPSNQQMNRWRILCKISVDLLEASISSRATDNLRCGRYKIWAWIIQQSITK